MHSRNLLARVHIDVRLRTYVKETRPTLSFIWSQSMSNRQRQRSSDSAATSRGKGQSCSRDESQKPMSFQGILLLRIARSWNNRPYALWPRSWRVYRAAGESARVPVCTLS